MDVDDYTQPLEKVMAQERSNPRPLPLKVKDHRELFDEWVKLNPDAMRDIELTALSIDSRGMRVSTKYLIEKLRYEGHVKLNPVTFYDEHGNAHTYGVCNTITPLLARWLLDKHPDMNIWVKRSIFDEGDKQ